MKPFRSIKSGLLIYTLCISLIPIAVIATIYYFSARTAIKREVLRELKAVAESRRLHVLSLLEAKKGQTIDFGSDRFIRDNLETINRGGFLKQDTVVALNRHLLVNKKPLDPHLMAVVVVDLDGKVVASANGTMIKEDISDQEIFMRGINGPYIGRPQHLPYPYRECIFISAPLTSRGGADTIGVIINYYDLAILSEVTANRVEMGETGEVVLGQKKGDGIVFLNSLRYAPDAPLSLYVPVDSTKAEPMRLALEGNSGATIAPDYRGVDVVAAYQYIPSLGWGLVVKMDKAEAFAPLKMLGIVALVVGLISAAAVASMGIVFATSTSRLIRKLTLATERLAAGDLDYRVKVARKDEIGGLADSFNTMAEGLAKEIAGREQAQEAIQQMAYYDTLTALPNRLLFNDRLTLALAHAHRNKEMLAVLYLDLDRFKVINDTLGHTVGDKLLQGVAERLVSCVRGGDTVARLGGDEFTLLLPGITKTENATNIARKILDVIKQPLRVDGRELRITTSIGIALYPDDGKDAGTLLRNADAAMYHAKEQGRDNFQPYTPALHAKVLWQLELEASLRRALEHEEFVVHYQPQVNINTGQIVGMEALVRWQHPDHGLVFPAEFISLMEDTGLIVPVGEWVLRTACAQNKAWQEAGLSPVRMAVNFSARQFRQQNAMEIITKATKETGLDPHYLELEITESVLMKGAHTTVVMLSELNQRGIHISIDDFGTGYSSLSYLKRFRIDKLKIDQSFARDIAIHPDTDAIVTAIIAMAHSLQLKVIAEGVETVEQLEFLRSLKCDEIQGRLFSQPLPAEKATKLLIEGRRLEK
ncbi:MAG: EAL domain-containing protein [Candidatus Brocadiales bacterium]